MPPQSFTTHSTGPLIRLKGVNFTYQTAGRRVKALRDITLDVERGEFVSICGPSGCGKSTLLNVMGTLDRPETGSLSFRGQDMANATSSSLARLRALDIGFVFQSFNLIDSLSVYENIKLALLYRRRPDIDVDERVEEVMDLVGIAHRARHLPNQLSGGQQQRCAIARAIVGKPSIILADEPTGNLDSENAAQIFNILQAVHAEGCTLVIVTHSPAQADQAERIVEMLDGRIQFTRRRLS
ncbi:ABC transporter ATP-binding protein [Asticcacaulis sp. 201]|uniref:ABC transporter ATP-binding protein n=1 Tax=Asticcacaulis sp. 201 TaxID=3028787 RepID=UPI0029166228|nr:ABC transporter ATP-binding protein [Asticcacaulis sp. 201]MDV6330889.1 ABC transporter ATP-binding protein [Asticcacaulis sp. 201]